MANRRANIEKRVNAQGKDIWYISFYLGKKRKRKMIGIGKQGKRDAEFERKGIEFDLTQKRLDYIIRDCSIDKFIHGYLSSLFRNRESTKTRYKMTMGYFSEFLEKEGVTMLSGITTKTVEDFMSWRMQPKKITLTDKRLRKKKKDKTIVLKPATINVDLKTIRSSLNWAVRFSLIKASPAQGVGLLRNVQNRPKVLTVDEIKTLLKYAGELESIIYLLVKTGLRRQELMNLEWSDIDYKKNELHVRNKVDFETKTGDPRTLPLAADLKSFLKTLPTTSSNYVLVAPRTKNRDMLGRSISRQFYRLVRRIRRERDKSFPLITLHSLRHTFISHLLAAGVSQIQCMTFSGHKDLRVFQRYSHEIPNESEKAISLLPF